MKTGSWKKKKKDDPLRQFRISVPVGEIKSSHTTVFDQETEAANLVGGKRHRGSGAKTGLRSDGSSVRYQIEAKQTKHQSIALGTDWLLKLSREAIGKSKVPLLHVRFLNSPADLLDKDWILVPAQEFRTLFELAKGNDGNLGRWDGYEDN